VFYASKVSLNHRVGIYPIYVLEKGKELDVAKRFLSRIELTDEIIDISLSKIELIEICENIDEIIKRGIQTNNEEIRRHALSKLTYHEKKALGL
jgi:hypothetical protein